MNIKNLFSPKKVQEDPAQAKTIGKAALMQIIAEVCTDAELIGIADTLFEFVPETFWCKASSSTGKYHPVDERGWMGNVRHTLKTIVVAKEMAAMSSLSVTALNYVVIALAFHDTFKYGPDGLNQYTVHEHPVLASKFLDDASGMFIKTDPRVFRILAKLVRTHMGRWTTSAHSDVFLDKPETKLQKYVHMCDYIASREAFDINIDQYFGGKKS